jgi:hypothetical protein
VLDIAHIRKLTHEALTSARFTRQVSVCALATDGFAETTAALTAITSCSVTSIEAKVTQADLPQTIENYGPLATTLGALLVVEPDLSTETWRELLEGTVAFLRAQSFNVALKCRCNGPTGIGPDRLAAAIAAASDAGLPFKVTGGLHHPIVEPSVYSFPMGFLNVAAAVTIRRARHEEASEALVTRLLTNESMEPFSSPAELSFGGLSLSCNEVREARAAAHISIGSCSLHEPDKDLSRLLR